MSMPVENSIHQPILNSEKGVVDEGERISQAFELWMLLSVSHHAIARLRDMELREIGISGVQAAVLAGVKAIDGPATPAEISRWLFREEHSVFGVLKQMEKQGLLRKVKDLEKRNMVRVVLTEKGERAYRHSGIRTDAITKIMSCFSDKERADFRAHLLRLELKALEPFEGKHPLHLWAKVLRSPIRT